MSKFINETLLPSLFDRYQNRDNKYTEIIVSEKVSDILGEVMTIRESTDYSSYFHSVNRWSEYIWNGRIVYLRKRGQYYFLSFGNTEAERKEFADITEERERQKEIDRAIKTRESGRTERIEKAANNANEKYNLYVEELTYDDLEEERIYYIKMAEHYKKIIDILTK